MEDLSTIHIDNLIRGRDDIGVLGSEAFTDADRAIMKTVFQGVVDRAGDLGAAVEVAPMLRIPNVIQQIPETPLVDIVIIVGADHSWFEAG